MNSFLSGLILFSSFSMRTPNDVEVVKDDYEISLGFKTDKLYAKRDWERERGEKYIDEEFWFVFEPENIPLYMKPAHVNKSSRNLKYSKLDTRFKKSIFSLGHTALVAEDKTEQRLSLGVQYKKQINGSLSFESKFDAYYFRDELMNQQRFDIEEYLSLNYKISEKLTLSNILDYNDVKGVKHYKFKFGIEYKL